MKRTAAFSLTVLLILSMISTALMLGMIPVSAEGIPTRAGPVRTLNSTGLPTSGTYTTISANDTDTDGKDEMFVGSTGYQTNKAQGIKAFEFSPQQNSWSSFGSGLPGTSSGKYYGLLDLGDINKDGNIDLVAPIHDRWVNSDSNGVEIYTGNGAGTFSLAHTINVGSGTDASCNEAKILDVDNDGNMDISIATYKGIRVFFGSGSATSWTESSPSSINNEIDGVGVGDLNGDNLLDLVGTPYQGSTSIRLYTQGSSRSWTEHTFKSVSNNAFGIRIEDLNGDSNNDVVYGTASQGIIVWLGNGGGSSGGTSFTWTSGSTGLPSSGGRWHQLELGDLDRDSKIDIISSLSSDRKAHVYLNNLSTGWTEIFTGTDSLSLGNDGYGAEFGDWDGDGDLDVSGCSWGGGIKAWMVTTGTPPPPINQKPIPDAGEDQDIFLGEEITLDGTGSTDPEDAPTGDPTGNILTYDWNVTDYPVGSAIRDSSLIPGDNAAKPTFEPDMVGTYLLTLRVQDTDEDWSEVADTDSMEITVIKPNDPPVANAGIDQTGYVGDEFTLDGSGSSDIDGTITAYEWRCTSHTVSFTGQGTVTARFTANEAATYIIRLRAYDNNDTWSEPDEMQIQVFEVGENLPPVAVAGEDQDALVGDVVTLDGSGSSDSDGDIIEWEWTSAQRPNLEFTNRNSSSPSFTATVEEDLSIRLRVRDDNDTWSGIDTVVISITEPHVNQIPVAEAGDDQTVTEGDTVTLDGGDSIDTDGIIVEYRWTCTSHTITLIGAQSSTPSFVPSVAEDHVFTLAVLDDEGAWSEDDTVVVHVSAVPVVEKYDIVLGPFLYEDDTIISNAVVILEKAPQSWTDEVNNEGMAHFDDVVAGSYQVKVELDGEVVITLFDITVEEGGSITVPGGYPKATVDPGPVDDDDVQPPDDDDDDTSENGSSAGTIVVLVIVILIFLAGAGVGIFMYLKGKQEESEEEEETEVEEKECPSCGTEMDYNEDFKRYKCPDCGKYQR